MQKIHVGKFGGFDELKLIEAPEPEVGAGQIGVEVRAAGLNFADIMAVSGSYPNVPSAPYDPGFEVAGTVYEVGEGVSNFKIGDRIIALTPEGGLSQKIAVGALAAFSIPDSLDFAPATALLVQGLTATFLLERGELKSGESVLIPSAAGGVGSLAIQIAKLKGAGIVIGLASPGKHERVLALGADAVFDYRQKGWGQQVLDATDGKGVDIWLDSGGDLESEGFEALAMGGRWLLFGGQAAKGAPFSFERAMTMLFKTLTLRGFALREPQTDPEKTARAVAELVSWVQSGQLQISADHRFPLAEARAAFEAISQGKTSGKVVVEI